MTQRPRPGWLGALLGGALLIATAGIAAAQGATRAPTPTPAPGAYGCQGMHASWDDCRHGSMMGGWDGTRQGMMGGRGGMKGGWSGSGPGPGQTGFVAGTVDAPRVVRVIAGPAYTFTPSVVPIEAGETITFEVTVMGPTVHEFKVGPLEAVIADAADLPEIANLGMMQTGSLTYTFDGTGPFGFACHEPGHLDAGMFGIVTLAG